MERASLSRTARGALRILVLALTALAAANGVARAQGVPYLVKDIDTTPAGIGATGLTAFGADVLFFSSAQDGDRALWRSDGTSAGTHRVGEVGQVPQEAEFLRRLVAGGRLYFPATTGQHGEELWVSDGTRGGTRLVVDLYVGGFGSEPVPLVAAGDLLYFAATSPLFGRELWVTDGTAAGTRNVTDVNRRGSSYPRDAVVAGGLVYFVATDDATYGEAVWATDGSRAGTFLVADVWSESTGSDPRSLVTVGSRVFFTARGPDLRRELYVIDDPHGGATRLTDIDTGEANANLGNLVVSGGAVYFAAKDRTTTGMELWRSDGTLAGTRLVADLAPGLTGSDPRELTDVGGALYFFARAPGGGVALWRSDGSTAGTTVVHAFDRSQCAPRGLKRVGARLFFVACDAATFTEPWTSDGTPGGTKRVADLRPGAESSSAAELTAVGDRLYFVADDGEHGRELWRSDGSAAGTALVADLADVNLGSVHWWGGLVPGGNGVIFRASDGFRWTSDGTAEGTLQIPGVEFPLFPVATLDGATFFLQESDDTFHIELRRTDGTPPGSVLLASFPWSSTWPKFFTRLRGRIFFAARDDTHRWSIWRSDGTPEGTARVWQPSGGRGLDPDRGAYLTRVGRSLILAADDGMHGFELWTSDGTARGTALVRDIAPGKASGFTESSSGSVVDDVFYFGGHDGVTGVEPWRSDATATGTYQVADVFPGEVSSVPSGFTRLGNGIVFSADGGDGQEPWLTDGTAPGTRQIADVVPGYDASYPARFVAAGDVAYFVAVGVPFDGSGVSLFLTDGTAAGTRAAARTTTQLFAGIGKQVLYVTDDGKHGDELWALSCGNGTLDALEECDQGDVNGEAGSCCSGACTAHDPSADRCVDEDQVLDLRRARVRGAKSATRPDGAIVVDAELPGAGSALDLAGGITLTVGAAHLPLHEVRWPAASCAPGGGGTQRCTLDGGKSALVVGPLGGGRAGSYVRATVKRLDLAALAAGPITVTVSSADGLRAGSAERCNASGNALTCRR